MQGDSSVCCLLRLHRHACSLSFKLVLIHPGTSILFNTAHVYGKREKEVHMVKRPGLPLAFSCCHGRRGDCHWVGLWFPGSVCSNLSSQLGECVEAAVTGNKVSLISKPLGCNASVRLVRELPWALSPLCLHSQWRLCGTKTIICNASIKISSFFWRSILLFVKCTHL